MRRVLFIFLIFLATMSAFLACFKVSTGSSYQEYSKLWDYRRLHPEFLPDTRTITLLDAGHTTTYADSLWIGLIQYIGDNTRGNRFYEFTNTLVAKITELHPYFVSPYNLSVLLAPGVDREKEDYEKNKKIAEAALSLGKKGIETTCDREKIRKIHQQEVGNDLWNKESLKNPCSDGMLPYYSASVANNLGETALAASYYKLASMNDDAPKASRFLVLLTEAKEGDRLSVAKRFLLIGVEGYDEDPYICKDTLIEILKKLDKKDSLNQEFVSWLTSKESLLTPYKNQNNPLASSPTNCYESGERAIKQLYLSYIDTITKDSPALRSGKELLEKNLLKTIPTLSTQKGWSVKKGTDNLWTYTQVFTP